MLRLSYFAGVIFLSVSVAAQSPHGKELKPDCAQCHTTLNWEVVRQKISFDHQKTDFPLLGQHKNVECKSCHPTLVFNEAKSECSDCHKDIHQNTVGTDCERCHDNESFIVKNITQIHQESRFPLLGAHNTADCNSCHVSESNLRFNVLGVECVDCHRDKYMVTSAPNHIEAGFSQNCYECHNQTAFEWLGAGFNHDFFPLTLGHASLECTQCHEGGNYTKNSSDCSDCHLDDYNSATVPNHKASGFQLTCTDCHTTAPGWKPAAYRQHDTDNFPIYSGKHNGKWSDCSECHTNTGSYTSFSCLGCHEHNKSSMDSEHRGRKDYSYESNACYSCHPRGKAD